MAVVSEDKAHVEKELKLAADTHQEEVRQLREEFKQSILNVLA